MRINKEMIKTNEFLLTLISYRLQLNYQLMMVDKNERYEMTKANETTQETILYPKDIANQTGRDQKAVRALMRRMTNVDQQPGSGGRWKVIESSEFHVELVARLTAVHNRKSVTATLKSV